jgi:hypothetical protein
MQWMYRPRSLYVSMQLLAIRVRNADRFTVVEVGATIKATLINIVYIYIYIYRERERERERCQEQFQFSKIKPTNTQYSVLFSFYSNSTPTCFGISSAIHEGDYIGSPP